MSVISHITLGTNDTERAGRFYDAVLGVLGFERLPKPPGKPPAYQKGDMPTIYLYPPEDGRPATWGNGTHIAFTAETKDAVHAFHETALRFGGSCEGQPGRRPPYFLPKIVPSTPRTSAWPLLPPNWRAKDLAKASVTVSERREELRFFGAAGSRSA